MIYFRWFGFIIFAAFSPVLLVSKAQCDDSIGKGEVLSLDRCINLALKHQPDILSAMGDVAAKKSRIGQAESGYLPQINLATGYSRYSPVSQITDRAFDDYSGGLSLTQNIYDFGKTSTQVKISRLNLASSSLDLRWIKSQVIFNVRQAYFAALKAKRNLKVAQDTIGQFELHLKQAEGFYEVGTRPKFDVTKAQVDLSNARLNLIKAKNTMRLALAGLNNAMGMTTLEGYELEDNLQFIPVKIGFDEALKKAYDARPDLRSMLIQKNAAQASIELAKKGYYPSVAGNASYNMGGASFPLEDGWSVGVNVTFPVFSGFLTKYQVEEAGANLSSIAAKEMALKNTVFLDVKQSYLNLKEAEEQVPVAELAVKQAEENFEIATGRYNVGVGSPIEVTDAEVALESAKLAHIQALYDYKVAFAGLEKAMGE
ncbi:MAG: TolC family protein [Desulfobacteraceae bacterium]|nr:TolC family protein [Desulfobacteraceae bacterium]